MNGAERPPVALAVPRLLPFSHAWNSGRPIGCGLQGDKNDEGVYYRWIARGHEIEFPKDTRVEILLNAR